MGGFKNWLGGKIESDSRFAFTVVFLAGTSAGSALFLSDLPLAFSIFACMLLYLLINYAGAQKQAKDAVEKGVLSGKDGQ